MASVFLSYDRDDAHIAPTIAAALEKAGHSVWWDRHISGGSQFSKEIEQALDNADVVVVVWTRFSVESPWVRDEAGAGRDRGRLVPLSLDGTMPPLGFRQFQAIDLGKWRGRGKVPRLNDILGAIERQLIDPPLPSPAQTAVKRSWIGPSFNSWAVFVVAIGMFFVIVGLLIGRPWERSSSDAPKVSIKAADGSAISQEMARNLLTKLGSQSDTAAKFQLPDDIGQSPADIRFAVNGTRDANKIRANVSLASGSDKKMLWSQDFERPLADRSALDDEIASSAGRALRCALDEVSDKQRQLSADMRPVYLRACTALTEVLGDAEPLIPQLRRVTQGSPKFQPGWAQLLAAEIDYVSSLDDENENLPSARSVLARDVASARKLDPKMAEATLAELEIRSPLTPTEAMAIVDKAKEQDPDNPRILVARGVELSQVGRMEEGRVEIEAAAKLDPLSPATRANLILATIFAGKVDRARVELGEAKRLWPNSAAVQFAEYELRLRYSSDFEKMSRELGYIGPGFQIYLNARLHPGDATIGPYMAFMQRPENKGRMSFALQGLGEIDRPNEFYQLLAEVGDGGAFSRDGSQLFRPWMASIRRDPRFMVLAKRLGMVDYWQKSGQWPDFCADAQLRYSCKEEAAKLE